MTHGSGRREPLGSMDVRYLFVDMNSYFASVEQRDHPELRGLPVAVVPVVADTTCCIAASYEARRFGVKTGTQVGLARRLCPSLRLVRARPARYVEVHHEIVRVVGSCAPVHQVRSIDEMSCRLIGSERRGEEAFRIARGLKEAMRSDHALGPFLPCSVGLAPSEWLAKVAADLQKPDGLVMLWRADMPDALYRLALRDLPGIGPRMERRFLAAGVGTVEQLCDLTVEQMSQVWGSKLIGSTWYHRLRGEDTPEAPTRRRTLGHSHVLAPQWRTEAGSRAVLLRLVEKSAARLRSIDYWAGSITVFAKFLGHQPWGDRLHLTPTQDTLALIRAAVTLWDRKPAVAPLQVAVTLTDLVAGPNVAELLFQEDRNRLAMSRAIDKINKRFGPHAAHFGGMHGAESQAPTRIAFGVIPDMEWE
ncbi:MAG: hypothetical protein U0800_18775 [Isosphaeraceae bacterium]